MSKVVYIYEESSERSSVWGVISLPGGQMEVLPGRQSTNAPISSVLARYVVPR